jgi:hypothetical protein
MVRRSLVDAGMLFEKPPGIDSLYDSWFNARVHARGATLVYNAPLTERHQGHETTTSELTDDDLTAEFLAFRKLVLSLMPKDVSAPSLRSAEGMVRLIRALVQLRDVHIQAAMKHVFSVRDPTAYSLAIRWLLRKYRPRRFSPILRTVIWKNETEMAPSQVADRRSIRPQVWLSNSG